MNTTVALLRGVNVGGKNKIRMEELRGLCVRLGLRNVRTYIQSGNIVFDGAPGNVAALLEREIEAAFGIRTAVIARTAPQLREIVERNPFPGQDPQKTVVSFLASTPSKEAVDAVGQLDLAPETVHVLGSEMFIYFPNGQGASKLPMPKIERTLGTAGTARNWNSVLALLAMAEETA